MMYTVYATPDAEMDWYVEYGGMICIDDALNIAGGTHLEYDSGRNSAITSGNGAMILTDETAVVVNCVGNGARQPSTCCQVRIKTREPAGR